MPIGIFLLNSKAQIFQTPIGVNVYITENNKKYNNTS